ncbi:Ganglioside induced differentiation associated protein [Kappamyces sp. JEL0829]|nr:Ganglioside induced differentiation associated protein [Kappamyces sp. JEL0829]KAJ3365018.1 Ganglioside induced differentiation associated protein [Kappamyces sp. JEL0680]
MSPAKAVADATKLVLYDHLLAFFPARARLAMMEKGFPYQSILVDIFNGQSLSPEFVALNPEATLPVLVHGDKLFTQSTDIILYLDSLDGKRLGQGEVDMARVDEWVSFLRSWDGNLYMLSHSPETLKSIMGAFNNYKVKYCEARAKEHPDLAPHYKRKVEKMTHEPSQAEMQANQMEIESILSRSETTLISQPYLAGQAYSLADLLLTTILVRLHAAGTLKKELASRPSVSEWYSRMKARPSFKKTFEAAFVQKVPGTAILPAVPKLIYTSLTGRV